MPITCGRLSETFNIKCENSAMVTGKMLDISPTFTAEVVCSAIYNRQLNAQIPVAAINNNLGHH